MAGAYRRQQEESLAYGEFAGCGFACHGYREATTDDYLRARSKKVARTARCERKLERMLESTEMIEKPSASLTMAAELPRPRNRPRRRTAYRCLRDHTATS